MSERPSPGASDPAPNRIENCSHFDGKHGRMRLAAATVSRRYPWSAKNDIVG
jgi:hypothetical protein